MDQVVDAYFSSCRYIDCVVSSERQCLYDSRCDISGIDEVPCLISIATDGMDDCREMMPGKEQVESSTILAKISPCQSDLWESGSRGFIHISFRYSWKNESPRYCGLRACFPVYQNLNVSFMPSHCWSLSLRFSGVPSSKVYPSAEQLPL